MSTTTKLVGYFLTDDIKMRVSHSATLLWLLASSSSTTTCGAVNANKQDKESSLDDPDPCGLYLAASTTSTVDAPAWGAYAGKDYKKHENIGFGDIAIQTYNLLANSMAADNDSDVTDDLSAMVDFFEEFIWVPQPSGGQFELDEKAGRIVTAMPGIGVVGGYNPKLVNSNWNHSNAYHREAWNELPQVAHPGRGAYSQFYETGLSATTDIAAGTEIFPSYGENWDGDGDDDDTDETISQDDYTKIHQTAEKMMIFFETHADLEEENKMDIYNFLVTDVMAAAAGPKKGSKITNLFPPTPETLAELLKKGGALFGAEKVVRTTEWLQQFGRCMDNIRPGPSTIPHAGRGAFAHRDIPQGGLVAPVPLIQIPQEQVLDMHKIVTTQSDDDGEPMFVRADDETVIGQQLLLNYCYGHPESTLMFVPGGAVAAFINHSQEKTNAKMVWSKHPNHHKHWFQLEPDRLVEEGNQYLGLLMEIVATKPILEGDEIFIDYGDEWQEAWDKHEWDWHKNIKKGIISKEWPLRALDLNQQHKNTSFATLDEQQQTTRQSYPDNVMQKCFLMVKKPQDEPAVNKQGQKVRVWAEAENDNQRVMDSENLFDCTILERQEIENGGSSSWNYTALWKGDAGGTLVKHVPHRAIVFADKPGTGDQHTLNAFRHYIQIPDDVFPQGPWRNSGDDDEEEDDEE